MSTLSRRTGPHPTSFLKKGKCSTGSVFLECEIWKASYRQLTPAWNQGSAIPLYEFLGFKHIDGNRIILPHTR